ncbi:hypothetical protein HBH56_117130 [Parastagonospora nodorum]|uniref:Uncharacterized protein n=1 Tax=Phaeosphaeria nodorum (strain SN15 / ATCC MYA-4574 / FGSC 10173) TaxID=321614 RepID=A0A7U2FH50_PHANO|nr:hypothetical protein HBH56_117130 [Parastagonospora nodorum]QRD05175.1 hypothetical protein JI435_444150 [Parastagonospora nodorum SN15]KAH4136728.1 hypothetical protein HBH45_132890 [Parastagonospora nodorum]KAH4410219.1 hypothetical protein HBH92_129180 [Parastagonospora nodorum]KAH4441219.1 hypothetical protein HBH91_171250 [Parastagonospora nodorum]
MLVRRLGRLVTLSDAKTAWPNSAVAKTKQILTKSSSRQYELVVQALASDRDRSTGMAAASCDAASYGNHRESGRGPVDGGKAAEQASL